MIMEAKAVGGITNHIVEANSSRSLVPVSISGGKSECFENCSEHLSAVQGCPGLKDQHRLEQGQDKSLCDRYIHRRSVKALARRIGKGLCDSNKHTKRKAKETQPENQASDGGALTQKNTHTHLCWCPS